MDDRIKQIIESGLMESYLLGQCTPEETEEIDALLENSEDLQEYMAELEDVQFALTESVATAPPPELKEKIKLRIKSEFPEQNAETGPSSKNGFNWMAFAVSIGLLFFIFLSIRLYIDNFDLQRKLDQKENLVKEQLNYQEELNARFDALQDQFWILYHEGTERIELKGNARARDLDLVAFWNSETEQSMLSVNKLPELEGDRCFQLWADVDGDMIDMGVIEASVDFIRLEYLAEAKSLNVTIEPEGGSVHATVSELVVSKGL